MPKIKFLNKSFKASTLAVIKSANTVIQGYLNKGFKLTLRQLYYQFIAQDLFPDSWIDPVYNHQHGLAENTKNTEKNYGRLGDIVANARLAGLIDWDAIEDRGRNLKRVSTWDRPEEILDTVANVFRVDTWEGQPYRPEVWIEKEALTGVISGVCDDLRVPYFACKGYCSQSEAWEAGYRRLAGYLKDGQSAVILYLGDHDPSGLDMNRDLQERLSLFCTEGDVEVRRIALTMDQIEEFTPPPNPAKPTDARFAKYVEQYGDECWELDALDPQVMADLIRGRIEELVDWDRWEGRLKVEEDHKLILGKISARYEDVAKFLNKKNGAK